MKMAVHDELKSQLGKKCRTVTEIANSLGVGRPAVSNMLNGRSSISVEMAIKIEEAFGINAYYILHAQLDEHIYEAKERPSK